MSGKRRPKRDLNTAAFNIVRQATGQEPERRPPRPKDEQKDTEKLTKPKG